MQHIQAKLLRLATLFLFIPLVHQSDEQSALRFLNHSQPIWILLGPLTMRCWTRTNPTPGLKPNNPEQHHGPLSCRGGEAPKTHASKTPKTKLPNLPMLRWNAMRAMRAGSASNVVKGPVHDLNLPVELLFWRASADEEEPAKNKTTYPSSSLLYCNLLDGAGFPAKFSPNTHGTFLPAQSANGP